MIEPPVRILSSDECAALTAALRDPEYVKGMLADVRAAELVEVDNPFRRELRPRRGTE